MRLYHCKYRRKDDPSGRVYRTTVVASSTDEARAYVALMDPAFGHTTVSPRRGREVTAESADGLTQSKWRDELMEGTAHFEWHGHDIEVEVVD